MSIIKVPDGSNDDSPSRLKFHSAVTAASAVVTVASIALKHSIKATAGFNLPFRIASLARASQEKSYYRIGFDALAFGLLFCPYIRILSVGVDLFVEFYPFDFKLKEAFGLQKKSIEDFATITPEKLITIRLNPKDLGEACRLLNVPYPNDMDPNEFIDLAEKKHSLFVTTLTKKQSMVSQIFSDSMQILIDDAHIALQTVKESVRQRSFS